jgi:hypothetical protein
VPRNGTPAESKICRDVAFSSVFAIGAYSGKLYALGKPVGPWQTRLGSGAARIGRAIVLSAAKPPRGAQLSLGL